MSMLPTPQAWTIPSELTLSLLEAAADLAQRARNSASAPAVRPKRGGTLRPSRETRLWNELRAQLLPHVRRHGDQAQLARLLGLPRQRVNAYLTQGTQMPDAERTLQLIAWLVAVRHTTPANSPSTK